MIDIFNDIQKWANDEKTFALATVINTWGSGPRRPGAAMGITEDGRITGSVSGGCVEGDVIREAGEVLKSGQPKLLRYGVSNDDAWSVGLTCGGKIEIYLERFFPFGNDTEKEIWKNLESGIPRDQGSVLVQNLTPNGSGKALVLPGGKVIGKAGQDITQQALEHYEHRKSAVYEQAGQRLFFRVFSPKIRIIIIGASHIAKDLVKLARPLGLHTTVIDPRRIFTDASGFEIPPDIIHNQWPVEVLSKEKIDRFTFAVLLTHDPKIDDQALEVLLRSDVSYIGALGSRKTHEKRIKRLKEQGFTDQEIGRIKGPAGIELKGRTPIEIALSIISEIILVKNSL